MGPGNPPSMSVITDDTLISKCQSVPVIYLKTNFDVPLLQPNVIINIFQALLIESPKAKYYKVFYHELRNNKAKSVLSTKEM